MHRYLVALSLAAYGCSSNPPAECQIQPWQQAPYAATYTVKGAPPTCTIPGFLQTGDLLWIDYTGSSRTSISIGLDWLNNIQFAYDDACPRATCGKGQCGAMSDGCGRLALPANAGPGDIDCGGCPGGQTCGGGGVPNVCGVGACAPKTCSDFGVNCGFAGDGCDGVLNCGGCTLPDTCGGGGTPFVCGHVVPDNTNKPYSVGSFTSPRANGSNLCTLGSITPAEQKLGPGSNKPSDSFPMADVDAKYTFTNVSVYATDQAPGTQLSGDLHFAETLNGTACEVDYHFVAVWPAIDCTAFDQAGKSMPNSSLCNPCSAPDMGDSTDPNFPIACQRIYADTDAFGRDPYWCVLSGTSDPPQLASTPTVCH